MTISERSTSLTRGCRSGCFNIIASIAIGLSVCYAIVVVLFSIIGRLPVSSTSSSHPPLPTNELSEHEAQRLIDAVRSFPVTISFARAPDRQSTIGIELNDVATWHAMKSSAGRIYVYGVYPHHDISRPLGRGGLRQPPVFHLQSDSSLMLFSGSQISHSNGKIHVIGGSLLDTQYKDWLEAYSAAKQDYERQSNDPRKQHIYRFNE